MHVMQYLDQQAGVARHVRLAEVSSLGVLQPQHRILHYAYATQTCSVKVVHCTCTAPCAAWRDTTVRSIDRCASQQRQANATCSNQVWTNAITAKDASTHVIVYPQDSSDAAGWRCATRRLPAYECRSDVENWLMFMVACACHSVHPCRTMLHQRTLPAAEPTMCIGAAAPLPGTGTPPAGSRTT